MTTALMPTGRITSNLDLYARRWDAFAFRVKQFTCSLSREHRATVAGRPRFYSLPYLRRADEPTPDDCLP